MGHLQPDWLNVGFVTKVLKNSEKDASIEVKQFTTKPVTIKGDNLLSDMIRVFVEYSRSAEGRRIMENKSLVVKISPTVEGAQKDLVTQSGIFSTEINMIEKTLPKMNEMLRDEACRLSAQTLYAKKGEPTILVFEDLAPLGYRMGNRTVGLDLRHCRLAMRKMAKFHATSVALVEKEPIHSKTFSKGIFHMDQPDTMKMISSNGMKNLAREVENWPELGPSYARKLEKLVSVSYAKAAECCRPSTTEFQVINHGDFWLNNMLFRYDDQGNPIGSVFVDFQMCVWSSPAIDILYFLHTSTPPDVFFNHRDELIREYHDSLTETMLRIGCKTQPPSLADLEKSIDKRAYFGVVVACICLPLVSSDASAATDLNEVIGNDTYNNPTISKPIFRNRIIRLLLDWDARGLLEA